MTYDGGNLSWLGTDTKMYLLIKQLHFCRIFKKQLVHNLSETKIAHDGHVFAR